MELSAQASLIVAMSDLKVVRLLRDAIRTTALAAGGVPGPLGTIINPHLHSSSDQGANPKLQSTQQIEPRPVFHPTPYFYPRQTIHPQPKVEPTPPAWCAPVEPEKSDRIESPIKPPWRVHPWETPIQPAPVIKVVQHRTDVRHKGSLIDLFI